MNACNVCSESFAGISYWRLAGGTKVDFIINNMEIVIEAKAAENSSGKHLKVLRRIKEDHHHIKRRWVVCCERRQRVTDDGIEIVPAKRFIEMLWQGHIW
jgi:predicted AAA+ superfamily ATPase